MIETNRLILRLMRREDFNEIFGIFTDQKVMESFNLQSFSRSQMHQWMDRNLAHQKKYGYGPTADLAVESVAIYTTSAFPIIEQSPYKAAYGR